MAIRFRKSKKIGPFRINLSGSGIGVSAGVKGYRVGVDAKGRSYRQASAFGFYDRSYGKSGARKSQSARNRPGTVAPTERNAPERSSLSVLEIFQLAEFPGGKTYAGWILAGWFAFLILGFIVKSEAIGGIAILALPIILFGLLIRHFTRNSAGNKARSVLKRAAEQRLDEWDLAALDSMSPARKEWMAGQYFVLLLQRVADDLKVDESEKAMAAQLKTMIAAEDLRDLTDYFYTEYVREAIGDGRLSTEEDLFLRDFAREFDVSKDAQDRQREIVEEFREIAKVYDGELPVLSSPSSVADKCHYSGPYKIYLKSGKVKESGTMVIAPDSLHLIGDGHKKVAIGDILGVEIGLGISGPELSITVKNRKTPIMITPANRGRLAFVILFRLAGLLE